MTAATLDDAQAARTAGADALSLALMDARNRLLLWLSACEGAPGGPAPAEALWRAGHAAWWVEYWIVRNVQAQRGEACETRRPRLASIDPRADDCFHPARRASAARMPSPPPERVRGYMADTFDAALELLAVAGGDDAALYFYRLALRHEDRCTEALMALAQAAGLAAGPWPGVPARPDRPALTWPAQRMQIGSVPGGLVPGPERWQHELALPEFEIDAQAVSWARYLEFALDGGYDEPRWWTRDGWSWAERAQRRAPRYVEQLRQGVVLQRHGRLQRAAPQQPAAHVTRHEAEAWCHWAGRRLPTEPEWELAACSGASRGFVWGDVYEWVAGSARAWPGHAAPPAELDPLPEPGEPAAVLRGASWLSPGRLAHPRGRRFVAPDEDVLCTGFRSCAR